MAGYTVKDYMALSPKDRPAMMERVTKLERKIFPSSEAFDYNVELKKRNIGLMLVFQEEGTEIVAYLVYQRMKRLVWLHKLCVIETERKKGIARWLVHALQHQMQKGGGERILLWVDEHREPARALYGSCGFRQIEFRLDYYAPGRAGLKMEMDIGG
jgi:ribosomal protein S18 acetylase RimI-like enzyme